MTPINQDSMKGLQLLREKFPDNQISYLPKGGVQLAYVGHAALTDRLLDADPNWSWEPLALGADGLPAIDECGGLWIKLTVCGITRLGYGDAQGKTGANAMKERIGDALRNAAMRFGAALDLWHKGELHAPEPMTAEAMIDTLRAAAMNGTAALKTAYGELAPPDALWREHGAALKLAAQKADQAQREPVAA